MEYEGLHTRIEDGVLFISQKYLDALDIAENFDEIGERIASGEVVWLPKCHVGGFNDLYQIYHPDYMFHLEEVDADMYNVCVIKQNTDINKEVDLDTPEGEDCLNLLILTLDQAIEDYTGRYGWDDFE